MPVAVPVRDVTVMPSTCIEYVAELRRRPRDEYDTRVPVRTVLYVKAIVPLHGPGAVIPAIMIGVPDTVAVPEPLLPEPVFVTAETLTFVIACAS
jgi:hypothetical protein